MSGHYATLLRSTVKSLLPDCEVFITDWHNARDIPVSEGKFDIEDYTLYLMDFMRALGPDTHVIAVCQPAPLTLAATAYLAELDPDAQPRSLTLIGGPVDPDATPTDVTDFGRRVTMGQLEEMMIQRVGFKHPGVGRSVYPGLLQLASFVSMNAERHVSAFTDQIQRVARGEAGDHDAHNKFYDEYLAVMDMTAEFYLSTVERIFKGLEIASNAFVVDGHQVDIGKITNVAVKTVEGGQDDISAPGQCVAALDLCTGLPDHMKASHLEPKAGHYGIFAGRAGVTTSGRWSSTSLTPIVAVTRLSRPTATWRSERRPGAPPSAPPLAAAQPPPERHHVERRHRDAHRDHPDAQHRQEGEDPADHQQQPDKQANPGRQVPLRPDLKAPAHTPNAGPDRFRRPVGFHRASHARKACVAASGVSRTGRCPASSKTSSRASGIRSAMN